MYAHAFSVLGFAVIPVTSRLKCFCTLVQQILHIVVRMISDICLLLSNVCYWDSDLLNVSILKRIRALTRYTFDLCGLGAPKM